MCYGEEMKFTACACLFISYKYMNNFKALKSFFVSVIILHVVVIGEVGRGGGWAQ